MQFHCVSDTDDEQNVTIRRRLVGSCGCLMGGCGWLWVIGGWLWVIVGDWWVNVGGCG